MKNIVRTYVDVARHFGVTKQTVHRDWVEGGMPGEAGRFDLRKIEKWRGTRRAGKGKQRIEDNFIESSKNGSQTDTSAADQIDDITSIPPSVRKVYAEARKLEAEAIRKERENAEADGRLVDRTVVIRDVSELVIRLKQRLSAAPAEMEMQFPRKTRKQNKGDFDEFVKQLLAELATMQVAGTITDDMVCEVADQIREEE